MPEPEEPLSDAPAPIVATCDLCDWLSAPAEPLRAEAARIVHLHEAHGLPL